MREYRKTIRVASRLRCWCEGENVTVYARVGNLSEGGLFLKTSTPLEEGTIMRVKLKAANASEIQATARVVWSRRDGNSGPPGMGLAFDPLDSGTLDTLRRMIQLEGAVD